MDIISGRDKRIQESLRPRRDLIFKRERWRIIRPRPAKFEPRVCTDTRGLVIYGHVFTRFAYALVYFWPAVADNHRPLRPQRIHMGV